MLLNSCKYGWGEDVIYWRDKTMNLYGDSKLKLCSDEMIFRFSKKANYLCDLFRVDGPLDLGVYLFLDEEKFHDFLEKSEDELTFEPYKKAAYNKNKIVILVDEEKLSNKMFHYANTFAHMYFHVLWALELKGNAYGTKWFEEGLAQLVSDERNKLEDMELYKDTLLRKVFDEQWKIPMIENLFEHGNQPDKFDSNYFNGYTISYMLVRYLRDQYPPEKYYKSFRLGFTHFILDMNQDIIKRAYTYYGALLKLPGYQLNFSEIKNPTDLFDFMELNITHGWIDDDGKRHEHSLEGIKDNYHINSLEQVLESGLATCIEQTMIEHMLLDNLGIKNKVFVNRYLMWDEKSTRKVRLHCFCAYSINDHWYYFEHANKNNKGIHWFYSLNDLCNYHLKKMDVDRFLTEIPDIPAGYTLKEFNEYVESFKFLGRGSKMR